ncbi:MAG: DUF4149 domain-containing protein [Rhodoferax sp.]|uniref:DUF4149 domain-containing protein n=1 Tax=Rhodoferax sp. TaxID=50421 RepID=UPI001857C7B7|nr:DUF4149 domain-containing protein [Rhodoferax sp.]NMM15288.1 DUF4149 domain-containing protein [Rhodoferax sp.]NMM21002.1 DUF4149 domain-containing protein [Rhodoferax sp.]
MPRLPVLVAALWWVSLSTIGFLVVPMLFVYLPTPAMAGSMAAKLFSAQTWVSSGCGMLLLILVNRSLAPVPTARVAIILVAVGVLMALLAEFAVAPRIVARDNLRVWHSVGSAMYLLQWLCAAATFWKLMPPRQENQV